MSTSNVCVFFLQAEDGIRDRCLCLEFRRVLFRSPLLFPSPPSLPLPLFAPCLLWYGPGAPGLTSARLGVVSEDGSPAEEGGEKDDKEHRKTDLVQLMYCMPRGKNNVYVCVCVV